MPLSCSEHKRFALRERQRVDERDQPLRTRLAFVMRVRLRAWFACRLFDLFIVQCDSNEMPRPAVLVHHPVVRDAVEVGHEFCHARRPSGRNRRSAGATRVEHPPLSPRKSKLLRSSHVTMRHTLLNIQGSHAGLVCACLKMARGGVYTRLTPDGRSWDCCAL